MLNEHINVLFLDFDGVINTQMFYKDKIHQDLLYKDNYYIDMCSPSDLRVSNTQAVTLVDMLCHKFNLKIVVSSTWRLHQAYKETLYNSGLSKDIEILGSLDFLYQSRGKAITKYINEYNTYNKYTGDGPVIDNYIILDDDSFDLQEHKDYLIQTNTYDGFTFSKYLEAISMIESWKT